jgi:hypothetical protein
MDRVYNRLSRKKRIKMFLNEYYFGYSLWITIMRLIGGPFVFLIGINMYQNTDRFGIAYGGFCIIYGLYYTLKPAIWIISRLDSFKAFDLSVEIFDNKLKLKDNVSDSEILLDSFRRILKRKSYYAFEISKFNKLYIPFNFFTEDQKKVIELKLKNLEVSSL